MCEDCDYCDDGECLAHTVPDYEAIAAYDDQRDWDRGEPIRWGGLDIPS